MYAVEGKAQAEGNKDEEERERMEFRCVVVMDDVVPCPSRGNVVAQHGLSLYLDFYDMAEPFCLLFDTGTETPNLQRNLNTLKLDTTAIRYTVISHAHYDHMGGLAGLLGQLEQPVEIIAGKGVLEHKFRKLIKGETGGRDGLKRVGIPESDRDLLSLQYGHSIRYCGEPYQLAPGVILSGQIELRHAQEAPSPFFVVKGAGGSVETDTFREELALYIKHPRLGLMVITGCAHRGIINTLDDAMAKTGCDRVYGVVGGFHLFQSSDEHVAWVIDAFKARGVRFVLPLHCTGLRGIIELVSHMKRETVLGGVGVEFDTRELDD